ncbi:MAG: Unknown protein [uncultured Sulfurovum sp.]|uniref:Uncharacterized protein n=1 Tax=uncultured Sulfurovum sp. TaxID=269237 RepID=A0A6S6SN79_9BACT|nr:MAG: Unknown protein [uncultured Sulfurovum sp.]
MIKKALLIALLVLVTGCVGTVRIAEETGNNMQDLNTPAVTKGEIKKEEN